MIDNFETINENLRIIGYAGVGKTTYILNNFSNHEYILSSFTCISSNQIKGNTLSYLFKLGKTNEKSVQQCVKSIKWGSKIFYEFLQVAKGIVVDEFFTVPADIMLKVDLICQEIREDQRSFGGLQLILVGDDRQTEAVGKSFVDTNLYKSIKFKEIILPEHKNMRLTSEYMSFCNLFRNPNINRNKMLRLLKDDRFSKTEVKGYHVYYTNSEVNKKNKESLKNFDGEIIFKKNLIEYKKDCPIYITSNSMGLYNGMMGFIRDVKKNNNKTFLVIEVDKNKYEIEPNDISFIPGFALTIHKCQSKTWDGVNIYIKKNDLFKERSKYIRLLYVALTRVRNFDKCYINISMLF